MRLRYGCTDLMSDRTLAIAHGRVRRDDVDVHVVEVPDLQELRGRLLAHELDLGEMSLAGLVRLRADGDTRLIGLPVVLSRAYRHDCVFVPDQSPIEHLGELAGARIGLPAYDMTAAVWFRRLLREQHGVPPEECEWVTGGLLAPRREPVRPLTLRGPGRLRHEGGRSLVELLAAGEIQALFTTTTTPSEAALAERGIRRLYRDAEAEERNYERATGQFPAMHVLAARSDLLSERPSLARSLVALFRDSVEYMLRKYADGDTPVNMYPWLSQALRRQAQRLDGYGYLRPETIGPELQAFAQEMSRQGLAARDLRLDELVAGADA